MAGAQQRDPNAEIARRLRSIEWKLDVLIEAQGLEGRVAEREEAARAEGQRRREQISEQMRRGH